MAKKVLNEINIEDLLGSVDLQKATNIVLDAYHKEGYFGGDFEQAHFVLTSKSISLVQPYYTQFMLFGRKPGRMPPIAPIMSWTKKYGIAISPWAVAKHIGKYGTDGNDFITPIIPELNKYISEQIKKLLDTNIVSE